MVKLILGLKGSGKTKTLIDMVNNASHSSHGNVGGVQTNEICGRNSYEKSICFHADVCGMFVSKCV